MFTGRDRLWLVAGKGVILTDLLTLISWSTMMSSSSTAGLFTGGILRMLVLPPPILGPGTLGPGVMVLLPGVEVARLLAGVEPLDIVLTTDGVNVDLFLSGAPAELFLAGVEEEDAVLTGVLVGTLLAVGVAFKVDFLLAYAGVAFCAGPGVHSGSGESAPAISKSMLSRETGALFSVAMLLLELRRDVARV